MRTPCNKWKMPGSSGKRWLSSREVGSTRTQAVPEGTCCHYLPQELWVKVFRHISPVWNDVPRLALVCKTWRDILKHSASLWRRLHVDPSAYTLHHFCVLDCILRQYGHHIKVLIWKNNSPVYESTFRHISQLTSLRSLKLPILWTRHIVDCLSGLSMLESVDIHGKYSLMDDDLIQVARQFPRLRAVSLNACWALTAEGLRGFLELLPELTTLKLKVNSNLALSDQRGERAMDRGLQVLRALAASPWAITLRVLCLHFVPIETEELTCIIRKFTRLRKLSISNCENLTAVQIESCSLQKMYIYNLWNVRLVEVTASSLCSLTLDHGLDSLDKVHILAPRLRKVIVDGANVLRILNIQSQRLVVAEIFHCQQLDMRSLKEILVYNQTLACLRLGGLSAENFTLDEECCPRLQELCLLRDFPCNALHIRSATLRLIHTQSDVDLPALSHLYLIGNHLCKVSLVGVPHLRSLVIQCASLDALELNLCSDEQLCLETFVIHAINSIGFLRLFDCKVNLLSVNTPMARTIVLYRCHMTDYVLKMALTGCSNIAHLNLEKCSIFTQVNVKGRIMKYLNLFGCSDLLLVDLHCPELLAINLGHCPNVKLFLNDKERDLDKQTNDIELVLPAESTRWSHDFPPESYQCKQ